MMEAPLSKSRTLLPVVAALCALPFAVPAGAQDRGYTMGQIGANTVSVSVSFSYPVGLEDGDAEKQQQALEKARRRLYEIADKECKVLLATIASSCRLQRLNVRNSVSRRSSSGGQQTQLTANASYRIEPKPEI
jgi:hypothetical protein